MTRRIDRRPPTAGDALFAVDEDASTSGTLVTRDPDGDALKLSIVAAPRSGTVTLEGDRFAYQPNANFHGDDELVFIARDGELASAEARVTFRVGFIDDVPQLGTNAFSGPAGFRIAGQLVATDVDGDAVTFAAAAPQSGSFIEFDGATGRFVFEPLPSFGSTEVLPLTVTANGETTTGSMTLKAARVLFGALAGERGPHRQQHVQRLHAAARVRPPNLHHDLEPHDHVPERALPHEICYPDEGVASAELLPGWQRCGGCP